MNSREPDIEAGSATGLRRLARPRGAAGIVLVVACGLLLFRVALVLAHGGDLSAGGRVTRPWRGVYGLVVFLIVGVILVRDAWTGARDDATHADPERVERLERLERNRARKRRRRERHRPGTR
jgi:hypothetical protein